MRSLQLVPRAPMPPRGVCLFPRHATLPTHLPVFVSQQQCSVGARPSAVCGASSGHPRDSGGGSYRLAFVRKPKESVHREVLAQIARRANVDPSLLLQGGTHASAEFRFPMLEFRALALNAVGKLGVVDRGLWNRFKVQLCHLLLMFQREFPTSSHEAMTWAASSSHRSLPLLGDVAASTSGLVSISFRDGVEEVIDQFLERDREHVLHMVADPRISDDQRGCMQGRFELRRKALVQQVVRWCDGIVQQPAFKVVEPFLSQVLDIQPMPLFEQSGRDGRKTEDLVHRLVKRQLPPGWRLYSGARLLKTDDEVFPNQKFLKGEADLLLTDPEGVVQAVLEVKTASGNLFLALSEDVVRFQALMERVRGRSVTFSLCDNSHVTLQFSPHLQPVYVLGCELHPDDLEAVAWSAQSKLLTMEVGRLLSTQVQAWGDIDAFELTPSTATVQLSARCLPELRSHVHDYFQTLASCEIYTLQRSAWSQRDALEADRLMERRMPPSRPQRRP